MSANQKKRGENMLSVIIPAYNEEKMIQTTADTVDRILSAASVPYEIVFVNDGSKDGTQEIAERYEAQYPTIVKAIQKENGGHGDAVNCGLSHATGKYFKVVDSDDWVDESSLFKILETVKTFVKEDTLVDMVISNYVYEKVGMEHKKVIRYDNVLPENTIFHWDEIGHFRLDQYILMHSVLYRTEMLKLCQLKLPKHTFYVDNIYVYYPHVRTLYYLNVDFYRYFIGREDQSVNEKIMIGRIDQQLFVTKTMISMYELRMISSKKLRKYMVNYLAIMMTVSSILCIRSKKPENLTKKKELWSYLKRKDYKTYMKIRYGILGQTMNLPGRSGRKVSSLAYSVARRLIGFN